MAALDLNSIRGTIESRLVEECEKAPFIPVVFYNQPFSSKDYESFVQCLTTFGASEYLSMGTSSTKLNSLTGLLILNIFTAEGEGARNNLIIGKRLRDLYNGEIVSGVIFDAPSGPEVVTASPNGFFQTEIRLTFEVYETLS
tara:strand:+ start:14099 stop:14524 length:426 start_codon:yes stop_codon:yes gene_type:complete